MNNDPFEHLTAIDVGQDTFYYEVIGQYTKVYHDDLETMFTLRFPANDNMVLAGIYAFGQGFKHGKEVGRIEKLNEVRRVLEM